MPPMTPSTVSDHLTCPNEAAATGAGVISENPQGAAGSEEVPSSKHTKNYWKWPFILDLPIKNDDFQ